MAASTGTPVIGFNGSAFTNNLKSAGVERALSFFEKLCKNYYVSSEWKSPDDYKCYANNSVLFFAMPIEWALSAGQQSLFAKGISGEIRGVPMPKDPNSTTYEMLGSPYGYLVPAGASNITGAAKWITCAREHCTDAAILKAERDKLLYDGSYYYPKCANCKHLFDSEYGTAGEVCPECGTARKAKFKVVYSEKQMQVIEDMRDPKNFTVNHDVHRGLADDLYKAFTDMESEVKSGGSFTAQIDQYYNVINTYIAEYNEYLK